MAVTLNDIARLANVDKSTVSMTLRDHPNAKNLRKETREKIRKIAKELGYCSNENAISLRTGKVKLIALIAHDDPQGNALNFFNIPGIIRAASERGYGVKIFTDRSIEVTFQKLNADRIRLVLSLSVDKEKRSLSALLAEKMGLDLVFLFEQPHGKYPSINVDSFQSAVSAVEYFASLGHTKIGYIATGNQFAYQQKKYEGFIHGMQKLSLRIEKSRIIMEENVEELLTQLLSLPEKKRPTALFCSTDSLGMLSERIALKMALKIPEELSLIGFSNSIVCSMAAVPLTSMDENFEERALLAVKVLLKEIGTQEYPADRNFLIPSRLVIRESVCKCKNQ